MLFQVDECDVTFNFGLTPDGSFTGSDLAFCGMFGSPEARKHLYTSPQRATVGSAAGGANPRTSGLSRRTGSEITLTPTPV